MTTQLSNDILELVGQGSFSNQRENIFRVYLEADLEVLFNGQKQARLRQAHNDQSDITKAQTLKNISNFGRVSRTQK